MTDPFGLIDSLLVDLLDEGISSIAALRLLIFVRGHPRRFSEIEEVIGTERTVVNRMVSRCPSLLPKRAESPLLPVRGCRSQPAQPV